MLIADSAIVLFIVRLVVAHVGETRERERVDRSLFPLPEIFRCFLERRVFSPIAHRSAIIGLSVIDNHVDVDLAVRQSAKEILWRLRRFNSSL